MVWLNVPLDALAKRVTAVGTESRPLLPPDAAQHQVCFLRPSFWGCQLFDFGIVRLETSSVL